jgi:hypothetical protein
MQHLVFDLKILASIAHETTPDNVAKHNNQKILLINNFTRISVPLNKHKAESRIEGAEHKFCCNQSLITDEGMQHTTLDITLMEKQPEIVSKVCTI